MFYGVTSISSFYFCFDFFFYQLSNSFNFVYFPRPVLPDNYLSVQSSEIKKADFLAGVRALFGVNVKDGGHRLRLIDKSRKSKSPESGFAMHPSEIEFMAENETIQIVPTFNHSGHVHLICGMYGPFRAGLPMNVPVWVALNLRQKKTCRILPPDWMAVDKLQERLEEEKQSKYEPISIVRSSVLTVGRAKICVCTFYPTFVFLIRFFTRLPTNYYLEITQMLLSAASEDIPQGNEIKTAVKVSFN